MDATIRPQPGPQEAFLSSPADIAIYGGAAGGGKTYGLLLEPLRHINNPDFGAVCFRRTYAQVRNEGGLWDESEGLYSLIGAKANKTYFEWTFPRLSKVRFAHMQYEQNKYDWQGAQIVLIMFDELTHFSQGQFFYMLSRNRSTCGIRPYVRATTNPDADSWVASFIAWWIDPETGFPIPERSGAMRWFMRVNEEFVWGDSQAELKDRYPQHEAKSVTFIPARLSDNQVLMQRDPGYLANLMALPLVERERLLGGNWKIVPAGGKVFNRYWFNVVDQAPVGGVECRYWDFAATAKKMAGDDPDFTAAVKVRKHAGRYYVLDCIAVQAGPAEVDRLFRSVSAQDRETARGLGIEYRVRWEVEPGSAGIRDSRRLVQMLDGLDARGRRPTGDKLTRARGLSAQSEGGNVDLIKGPWNESFLSHMHNQPDWPHDDIMDAVVGAYEELAEGQVKQVKSYQG